MKVILDALSNALSKGGRIEIRGFGSFALNYRPPRTGRNPKMGSKVSVPAKYMPHFKAGKELRERVDCANDHRIHGNRVLLYGTDLPGIDVSTLALANRFWHWQHSLWSCVIGKHFSFSNPRRTWLFLSHAHLLENHQYNRQGLSITRKKYGRRSSPPA